MRATPLDILEFQTAEAYWLAYLWIAWLLAWVGYGVYRGILPSRERWTWDRVVGVAFILFPFVEFAIDFIDSISFVLDTTSVAGAVPEWAWWLTVRRRSWKYVLVPLLGLFLAFGHAKRRDMRVGARLRDTLMRIRAWPDKGWTRDIVNGFGLFVVAWFGYLIFLYAISPIRSLDTGDESRVFSHLTPALAFALSITAGVTEEFLFRGILQTRLQRIMPVGVAIVIQSIFFGLIHSGYGTVGHIVAPMFFGVLMGLVVLAFGLWPAIIIHILLDLVIFLATAADNGSPWTIVLIPFIFLAGVALPVAYYGWRVYERLRDRQQGGGPGGSEWRAVGPPVEHTLSGQRNP